MRNVYAVIFREKYSILGKVVEKEELLENILKLSKGKVNRNVVPM